MRVGKCQICGEDVKEGVVEVQEMIADEPYIMEEVQAEVCVQWAVDNATDGDKIVAWDGTFAREDIIFKSSIITYSKDMKFGSVKRKLIDAKNKGIVGTQRHFFDKRALERDITPREIGEVIDYCVVLEEQNHDKYPKLRYKIKGETSFGKKLMLIVSITKEGYLYVKTGWEG